MVLTPGASGRATCAHPHRRDTSGGIGPLRVSLPPARPLDHVGCHASRSMRPRIGRNRCSVELSASWYWYILRKRGELPDLIGQPRFPSTSGQARSVHCTSRHISSTLRVYHTTISARSSGDAGYHPAAGEDASDPPLRLELVRLARRLEPVRRPLECGNDISSEAPSLHPSC